jgi:hypothetical protein
MHPARKPAFRPLFDDLVALVEPHLRSSAPTSSTAPAKASARTREPPHEPEPIPTRTTSHRKGIAIMEPVIFFARFWGWLTLSFSAILFLRPAALLDLKLRVVQDRSLGLAYGIMTLVLGIASVILVHEWTWHWHVLVTIFGWLALLKGLIVIGFPEISQNVKTEARVLSTRIALIVVSALAIWLSIATYTEA